MVCGMSSNRWWVGKEGRGASAVTIFPCPPSTKESTNSFTIRRLLTAKPDLMIPWTVTLFPLWLWVSYSEVRIRAALKLSFPTVNAG